MKNITIIGGGIAGIGAAKAILEKTKNVKINIITKDTYYMAGPSRPLLLTGEQKYERIIRGYEFLREKYKDNLQITYGLVTQIDPTERKVYFEETPTKAGKGTMKYDYLIIAPGVVYDGSTIEGYKEYWHKIANVYDPGRVDTLKQKIWSITRGKVIVYAPPMPYRCAPAPSETTMLLHTILKHRNVRDNVEVIHIDANEKPQPPVIADIIKQVFEENNIQLITSRQITEINDSYIVLDNGEKINYTILSLLEPNRAPLFITEAGLGEKWVEIRSPENPRSIKYDDILAAGDVAKLPFPKNQEIAYESSLYAANQILQDLGISELHKVQYAFLGWAYLGNPQGRLETLSVRFGLNFTTKPPKPSKDPELKQDYTKAKDQWEQAYLKNLFEY